MKRLVRSIVALGLAAAGCREGAQTTLAPTELPSVETPRDGAGAHPNPAPSAPAILQAFPAPPGLVVYSAELPTPMALEPADPAVHGLEGPVGFGVLQADPGGPLLYEVADARRAVLFRRDRDGTTRALRVRTLGGLGRRPNAAGEWEAWWDGAVWVQAFDEGAELRRYPVPATVERVELFAWREDVGALLMGRDGLYLWRLRRDGPPEDLGRVAGYLDRVYTESRECIVLEPEGQARLITPDGDVRSTTLPQGYFPTQGWGTRVVYMPTVEDAPWIWVDHETGAQHPLQSQGFGLRSLSGSLSGRYVAARDGERNLFVLDMESGEERPVPGSVGRSLGEVRVSDSGRVIFGAASVTEGVAVDTVTGAELHRVASITGWSPLAVLGETQVILTRLTFEGEAVARLDLATSVVEPVPGTWLSSWEGMGLVTAAPWEGELRSVGLGRAPRSLLEIGRQLPRLEVFGRTHPRVLYRLGQEGGVLDPALGQLWRGATAVMSSGDLVWSCSPASFVDLEASPAVWRSSESLGSCTSWRSRSSVVVQAGPALHEVYADGGRTATRALGEFTAIPTAGPDLWATRGNDLYRMGADGQPDLRWRLPWSSGVQVQPLDSRAVVTIQGPEGFAEFSIAQTGPVEGFRVRTLSQAPIPGLAPAIVDDQGRIVRLEGGRLVANGAEGSREVLFEPEEGLAVTAVQAHGGRWVAYVTGASASQVWWAGPEGTQYAQVSPVAMAGEVQWLEGGQFLVRAGPAAFLVEPAEARITRLPRGLPGRAIRALDGRRLLGDWPGARGLWAWDAEDDTVTLVSPPNLDFVHLLAVVR